MAKKRLSPNARPQAVEYPPDYARGVCAMLADALECAEADGATLRLRIAARSVLELLSTRDGLAELLSHAASANAAGDPLGLIGEAAGRAMGRTLKSTRN